MYNAPQLPALADGYTAFNKPQPGRAERQLTMLSMDASVDSKPCSEFCEIRINLEGLTIVITQEGMILDSFDREGQPTGTKAMTYSEWAESVEMQG